MSLQTSIRDALKIAMKDKDQTALDTLRGALSAFTNEAVSLGKTPQDELDDAQVQTVIKRLVKQRKDAIEQFTAGGRPELAETERLQLAILEQYLPAQMGEAEIRAIADRKVAELGGSVAKSEMGKLMGAIIKETGGQADGAVVKKVVEELLAS